MWEITGRSFAASRERTPGRARRRAEQSLFRADPVCSHPSARGLLSSQPCGSTVSKNGAAVSEVTAPAVSPPDALRNGSNASPVIFLRHYYSPEAPSLPLGRPEIAEQRSRSVVLLR